MPCKITDDQNRVVEHHFDTMGTPHESYTGQALDSGGNRVPASAPDTPMTWCKVLTDQCQPRMAAADSEYLELDCLQSAIAPGLAESEQLYQ